MEKVDGVCGFKNLDFSDLEKLPETKKELKSES